MVIGCQIGKLHRGGGAESAPRAVLDSKNPGLFRVKQMGSSSFDMFIYARREQCDLGPIYTVTNTQRIRIYPRKLKFHRTQDVYMANMP